ncbi:MAG: tetratricopeptide repeat protein [Bacteroidota bacterium]
MNKTDEAIPMMKKAARKGHPEAQYNLGYAYEEGVGVKQNMKRAMKWYKKSADQDYTNALYTMMMAYAEGNHVEQSHEQAFEYALKCAEQNDPTCMFNVIGSYKDGIGTEQDKTKMIEWAIRLGKQEAPKNIHLSGKISSTRLQLAQMYRDGIDVEKNHVTAYAWFLIFNEDKTQLTPAQQNSIIEEIKSLEEELIESDRKKAKKEAEELLQRPLTKYNKLYEVE